LETDQQRPKCSADIADLIKGTLSGASRSLFNYSFLCPYEVNGKTDPLDMIANEEIDEVSPEGAIEKLAYSFGGSDLVSVTLRRGSRFKGPGIELAKE